MRKSNFLRKLGSMSLTQEEHLSPKSEYNVPNPLIFGIVSSIVTWFVFFLITLFNFDFIMSTDTAYSLLVDVSVIYLVLGYLVYPIMVFAIVKSLRYQARGIRQYIIGTVMATTSAAVFSLAFYGFFAFFLMIASSGGQ